MSKLAMLGVLGLAAGALQAQEEVDGEWDRDAYTIILPFYLDADSRRGTTDEGIGMSLGYGRQWRGGWYWEGQAFTDVIRTSGSGFTDFYQYGIGFDVNYRFRQGASPFVLLGAGYLRNNVIPDDDDRTNVFGNVGIGFVTGALGNAGVRIRGEARYIRDRFRTGDVRGMDDRRVSLGVQVPLGRRVVERQVEVVREVEVERVVEVPVEVPVERAPPPQPPAPLRLEGVTFELNSATLTPGATQVLRGVADSLRSEPNVRVEVAGHTDSAGSADYNLTLSQQRAQAVVDFLVEQGIDRRRLEARGYGQTQPVASNDTAAGRSENRRVELRRLN